jgi:hypothetical protein
LNIVLALPVSRFLFFLSPPVARPTGVEMD